MISSVAGSSHARKLPCVSSGKPGNLARPWCPCLAFIPGLRHPRFSGIHQVSGHFSVMPHVGIPSCVCHLGGGASASGHLSGMQSHTFWLRRVFVLHRLEHFWPCTRLWIRPAPQGCFDAWQLIAAATTAEAASLFALACMRCPKSSGCLKVARGQQTCHGAQST